jgi:hypothetical protein
MIGIEIITDVDDQPLRDSFLSGAVRVFMRMGAYVRQNMLSRLTYDDKSSRPGEAPRIHRRPSPLSRIVFGMPGDLEVNIGPALTTDKSGAAVRALEEGGVSVTADGHTIHMQPRPFMAASLHEEAMKAPSFLDGAMSV